MKEQSNRMSTRLDRNVLTRREALRAGGGAGAALLISPALLAACGGSDDDIEALPNGPVINGVPLAATRFDPHTADTIGALSVIVYAYEGLYGQSPEEPYDIGPQLADGDPEEISPTEYRVRIRDGAVWHDGSPVTTEDVQASFDRILNPDTASLLLGFLTAIKSVKAADEQTIGITLNFPTTLLKDRLALVKIAPASITTSASAARTFDRKPVGSGPYRITSVSDDLREVRLERFEDYNGPIDASLPEIGVDAILEADARTSAVQTRRIQVASEPPFQAIDQLNDEPNLEAGGVPSFNQSLLIFNCAKAPFDDERVRQAILLAIDRDTITESVFFGRARPAVSYLPEDNPDFVEPETSLLYDPERARALLSEAGVPDLAFQLNLSNLDWLVPQGPLIQSNLQDIGVEMSIRQGETESLVQFVTDGSFDAWLTVTDPTVFGNDDGEFLIRWIYVNLAPGFLYWTSQGAKRLASLCDDALATESSEEAKQFLGEAQNIINDEAPSFPLHHRDATAAWTTGLDLTIDPVWAANLMQGREA